MFGLVRLFALERLADAVFVFSADAELVVVAFQQAHDVAAVAAREAGDGLPDSCLLVLFLDHEVGDGAAAVVLGRVPLERTGFGRHVDHLERAFGAGRFVCE